MILAFVANVFPGFSDGPDPMTGLNRPEQCLLELARALARRGHRVIVFGHGPREELKEGVFHRKLENFINSPAYDALIVFRHDFPVLEAAAAARILFWTTDALVGAWDERILPHVDHVLVSFPSQAEFVYRHYRRIARSHINVLGVGVSADYFPEPPAQLPDKPGNQILLDTEDMAGKLAILRSFPQVRARIPDAELIVPEVMAAWLHAWGGLLHGTELLEAAGVRFTGSLSREQLRNWQRQAKVMACPGRSGFGFAVLEGMAAGAVPVVTDAPNLRTVMEGCGALVAGTPGEPAYTQAFVEQVVRLLSDDERRQWQARTGRRRAHAEFGWEIIAERFERIVGRTQSRRPERAEVVIAPPVETPSVSPSRPISVAVVIPVQRAIGSLPQALLSVMGQLRFQDELIVISDSSLDNEPEASLPRWLRKPVLWLQVPAARNWAMLCNAGIRQSQADWLLFLGPGDVLAPFALNVVREPARLPGPEIQALCGAFHRTRVGNYCENVADPEPALLELRERNTLPSGAILVRREALLAVGLFDEGLTVEADWDLWLRLRERFGLDGFAVTRRPVCYCGSDHLDEQDQRRRNATVEGLTLDEHFRRRHGVNLSRR